MVWYGPSLGTTLWRPCSAPGPRTPPSLSCPAGRSCSHWQPRAGQGGSGERTGEVRWWLLNHLDQTLFVSWPRTSAPLSMASWPTWVLTFLNSRDPCMAHSFSQVTQATTARMEDLETIASIILKISHKEPVKDTNINLSEL